MFERPVQARWPDQGRFILAAIAMAMGLESFTSFAGGVLRHGGGAYLVAYLVAVATTVIPVLAVEFGVGLCYQASAPDGLRRLDRRLEWLGWWTTALAALAALAALTQCCWAALYGFDSLIALLGNRPLPWGMSGAEASVWFSTRLGERPISGTASAAAALAPVGALVVVAAIAWLVVHRLMAQGLAAIGRWYLVAVPIVVVLLIAVGVAVLYRPGAVDGVAAFLEPRWESLGQLDTWLAAYRAAFTTHALGLGIYIAYASHLRRGGDATGSALLVGLSGAGFSFIAGIVVSAAAGALAAARGVPLDRIPLDGPRDVFALLPSICAHLPLPAWGCALMSLLLSLCLMLLALNLMIGLVAAVTLAVADKWGLSWTWLNARMCLWGFFASLLLTNAAGPHLVGLLHDGLFPYGVAVAVAAQCLALARVSGGANLQRHLNAYSVIGVGRGWRILVMVVTPLALLGISGERLIALARLGSQPALWQAAEIGLSAGVLAVLAGVSLSLLPGRRVP